MVNVHTQSAAAPESNSRNNEERHHLCHSIQETLKGPCPRSDKRAAACARHASVHDVVDGLMLWLLVSAGEKELVVLGDFGCSPQSSELDVLRKEKFCPLVPPTQFTNISTRSPQGSRCLDNIWLSRSIKKVFSGTTPPGSHLLAGLSVLTGHDSPDRQNRTDHGQPWFGLI